MRLLKLSFLFCLGVAVPTISLAQKDSYSDRLSRLLSGRSKEKAIQIQSLVAAKDREGTAKGRLAAYCRIWEATWPHLANRHSEFELEFEREFDPIAPQDFTLPQWVKVPGRGLATPEYGAFLSSFSKSEQLQVITSCFPSDQQKAYWFNYSIERYRTAFLGRSLLKVTLGWGTAAYTGWIRGGIQAAISYISWTQFSLVLIEQRRSLARLISWITGKKETPESQLEFEKELEKEALAVPTEYRTIRLVLEKAERKEDLSIEEAQIARQSMCTADMSYNTDQWVRAQIQRHKLSAPQTCALK